MNTLLPAKFLTAHSFDESIADSFEELYKFQFVLSKSFIRTTEAWNAVQISGWVLQMCPYLKHTKITDIVGSLVGYFIGVGIDGEGDPVRNNLVIPRRVDANGFWRSVEETLATIAGRYSAIFITPRSERMYFDGALDQSVVFNEKEQIIASNPFLAATGPSQENTKFDRQAILNTGLYYAFEHTSDLRVKRAMPNHYLNLQTYFLRRHWPNEEVQFALPRQDYGELIELIQARLKQIITGFIRNYDCCLPVSGGRDSRLLLALAKDEVDHLPHVFTHATNHMSLLDSYLGKKVSSKLGVPHSIINVRDASAKPYLTKALNRKRFQQFAYRTGFQSGTRDAHAGLADAFSPKCDVLLRGNLMGMMAGQQYSRTSLKEPFNIATALKRLRVADEVTNEPIMKWGPRYFSWMQTLPLATHDRIYDLAFLELIQPHALGALFNGSTNSYYVNPFNDRFLLHATMCLPPRYRAVGKVFQKLLADAAPELADVPFTPQIKRRVVDEIGVLPSFEALDGLNLVAA